MIFMIILLTILVAILGAEIINIYTRILKQYDNKIDGLNKRIRDLELKSESGEKRGKK